jgi:hypothetical protein
MLLPSKAADSGRNAPKTSGLGNSGRHGHYFNHNNNGERNNKSDKSCCDGFGKVLSDELVKQFE